MAPSKAPTAPYSKDERVLCFHHEMLYEAKILDCRQTEDNQSWQYRIHYKGWKNTWDDWVPQDRVRKFTDENKELAAQLHAQMKALQQKSAPSAAKSATKKGTRANGSDFSSARGSEERHLSTAAQSGRGPRRNRDYDLEHLSTSPSIKKITKENGDKLDTMNAKRQRSKKQRSLSRESEVGSTLSSLSRSPTPPELWSSSFALSEERDVEPAIPAVKRPRVTNGSTTTLSRRSDRCSSGLSRRNTSSWMDPKSDDWDVLRVLNSEECLAHDPLLKLPPPNYTYIDSKGRLKDPHKYHISKPRPEKRPHPKLRALIQNETATPALHAYYQDLPHDHNLPIAGIIHGSRFEAFSREYILTDDFPQEEGFHARPSIKLVIPDHLKAILVDDWENVTKNQQLVPLPSAHPVNSILADYLAFEQPKRIAGSAQADILEEVVAGLKEYFDKCLGRILLYRFERNQYLEIRELWNAGTGEWAGKGAGDTYGAEHLCRLLVSLPELIAQTNMDQQSVNRLREELLKMTNWLGKNAAKYFVSEYESPSQSYIEKARGY